VKSLHLIAIPFSRSWSLLRSSCPGIGEMITIGSPEAIAWADPLRIPGLSPLQRLAYSEGILHWFSFPAQLVLLCTPLSLGLLGIAPILIGSEALVSVALPFFLCQLLLTRWLSGHARAAILPELYRWIFLLPICAAVVSTALGRPRRFRVTPKAVTGQGPAGPDAGLLLPLLVLLGLQLLALGNLAPGRLPLLAGQGAALPVSAATLGVVLGWSLLNGLLLLLAIRSCWDRPREDAVPWFALSLPLRLHHQGGMLPGRLQAISATGAELSLESESDGRVLAANGPLSLEGLLPDLTLPLVPMALRAGALGGTWGQLTPLQRDQLETLLYRREGLWPTLRAPFELRTLPLVLLRTLQRIGPESWFRRSLIPQLPPLKALPLPRHADRPAPAGVPDHAR